MEKEGDKLIRHIDELRQDKRQRHEKISELKRLIESGKYQIPAEKLSKILSKELDLESLSEDERDPS